MFRSPWDFPYYSWNIPYYSWNNFTRSRIISYWLSTQFSFYFRYVDDIILAASSDTLNDILDTFNSSHTRLKFTTEFFRNNERLKFFDIAVIVDENKIIFDKYQKTTFSSKFLNFHSHPLCHKKRVIYDTVVLLSHSKF